MAKVLDLDFERPWWGNPIVNGIGGGVASGGGSYAVTEDPQISGIVGVVGSVITGGLTYAATRGKVFDKSGHGNNGVMRNGAHIEDGILMLDGEDDFAEVPDDPSLDPTDGITVSTRIKIEEWPSQNAWVVNKTSGWNNGWHLWVKGGGKEIRFRYGDGTDGTTDAASPPLDLHTWYDILAIGKSNEYAKMLLNEKKVDETSSNRSVAGTDTNLLIGHDRHGRFVNCSVDYIRIYNRARR